MANVQRRRLLLALLERNPRAGAPIAPGDVTYEDGELERLAVQFHHVHLPKLEEYGFVDWDPQTNEVTKGPDFEDVRPLLELLRDHADELPDDWL